MVSNRAYATPLKEYGGYKSTIGLNGPGLLGTHCNNRLVVVVVVDLGEREREN